MVVDRTMAFPLIWRSLAAISLYCSYWNGTPWPSVSVDVLASDTNSANGRLA